jgi:ABC-2 type transport system ATP-binding protein
MNLMIETHELGKYYRDVKAVDNLSIRVAEGEIYTFLGLNGAGKTTTIRMLLGMIKPTNGYAAVMQTRVRLGNSEPWGKVGYLVEVPHAYPELSVLENLEIACRLHPGTTKKDISQIIEQMGLAIYADRRAGTLSLGNVQRLGLAKALLHHPRLIFLDEPANGLDPAGIVEIRELLLDLSQKHGVTIFMSSHILAEVSRLAQRIGIIHKGRLLQELNIDEVEKNRRRRLLIKTRDIETASRLLNSTGKTAEILQDGTLELKDALSISHPDEINLLLVNGGVPPTQLFIEEEELEQYFLRLVGTNGEASNE